ncbi:hypothetical protein ONZ45_g4707 [Pleurotus djamor]|nr:hypothetical protein ONZ45_g4707 [Pleurotus djamor]
MPEVVVPDDDSRRPSIYLHYGVRDAEKSLDAISSPRTDSRDNISLASQTGSDMFDPNLDTDSEQMDLDSPYPEVRSAVANFDDPSMPASTLRAWVLGIIWAMVIPGMNQFFYMRYPSLVIGSLVAQLVAFPFGRLWARLMPSVKIFGASLNPGPFTIKEHVLVTIMATVGAQSAYANDIVAVQRVFYNTQFNFGYEWMLVMSTQLIGFSIGGIARRFLVSPPSMNFFPGYLFQALSYFTWVCWIAPDNIKVNQLFGYHSGLGFSLLTFDWNQIAFIGSPLATPWWAEANVIVGFAFFYWLLTPILYYTNVWNSQHMPISGIGAYDNTGNDFDHNRILTPEGTLNMTAYQSYSPLFLPMTFVMSYGLSFLSISATITHTLIYFWHPIRAQFNKSLREQPDIHAQLMSRYSQVPEWHYACIFGLLDIRIRMCLRASLAHPITDLGVDNRAPNRRALAIVYVVPIGMIQAMTNRQVGLNVITELIIGYLLPGRPIAMMIFKTYGYITLTQALQFTADFKLGHYMKIPPRPMFWCQVVATVVAGTSQLAVQTWMFSNIEYADLFSIPHGLSTHSHTGIYAQPDKKTTSRATRPKCLGLLPSFGDWLDPDYYFLLEKFITLSFFFIIGAACPVVLYLIIRKYPNTVLSYLNFPLVFAGLGMIPPATAVNYVPWAIIGFIFQYVIRRKHFSYWAKYNYVLSAALDAGTAIGVILIYFCLQYPLNGRIGANTIQNWWGNRVYRNTSDWNSTSYIKPGERFGPTTW